MNPRDAAEMLLDRAKEQRVRFPKVWDESKLRQTCGATVVCILLTETGYRWPIIILYFV